jgi:FtsZ-binding cell division protein ZapB
MIEPIMIMYFGIGFLFATLMGVAVITFVHDRAVRLTLRRLESSLPKSMAEIQADKDLLRTEFAMSRRRLEIRVEELKEQNTSQLAELGRKSDVINRLKIEREVQKVETIGLKGEVEALKGRLN